MNKPRNKVMCDTCGGMFEKSAKHANRQKRNFCGKSCRQNYDVSYNKDFFSVIDSEEKAYWLGMIGADGWLDERDKALGLNLHKKDKSHVKKLAKLFKVNVNDYNKKCRCMVYSKTVFKDLIGKGITPRKSLKDNIQVFNHIPKNLQKHFVRGWFDGDGSIGFYKRKKYCQYQFSITGTPRVLKKLFLIIKNEVDITYKGKLYDDRSVKSFRFGGKWQVFKVGEWLYRGASIYLERKKKVFEEINESCSL